MVSIFRTVLPLVISLLVSSSGFAQSKLSQAVHHTAQKVTDWMHSTLDLADEQVDKVHAINEKYAKKTAELYKSEKSKHDKRVAFMKQQKEKDDELRKELTDKQYKAYQEHKKEFEAELKKQRKEKKKST